MNNWQHAMIDRPQQMNTISKHPKVKLEVFLNSACFQAGAAISGTIQVTSATSHHLRLGDIAVELEAFEELTSRDHAATQTFLYNRTLFQGQHLPPSNAVLPTAPHHGYWTARKGRTTFPFSFRLPASAPSSVTFAGNAALRYVVKATVQAWYQDSRTAVVTKADANVVEQWHDEYEPEYAQPLERVGETKLFMGGQGSVWLEAGIPRQLFIAGSKATIRAGIRNASKRDVSGLRIDVVRCLSFPVTGGPSQQKGPTITQVLHTQQFKGQPFEFASGCEQVLEQLAIDLPTDTRTIRKTRLFEVETALVVSLAMGSFAKDLQVKLPIYIAHPTSVKEQYRPDHYQHQAYNYQQPDFTQARPPSASGQQGLHAITNALPRSASAMGQQDLRAAMSPSPSPMMAAHDPSFIPRSQSAMGQHGLYTAMSPSPSPSPVVSQDGAFVPRSQSAMGQHGLHTPMPPSPAPMYHRPSSATGHNNHQSPAMVSLPSSPVPFAAYSNASPQAAPLQWDSSNNHWNPSQFQPFPTQTTSYLAPGPEAKPIPAVEVPAGLSTIAEDSESRANTVTLKSIRAMGGDRTGVRKSVSKTDVELFEELVGVGGGGASSEDSTQGKVPKASDVFAQENKPQQQDQSWQSSQPPPSPPLKAPSHVEEQHPPVPSKTSVTARKELKDTSNIPSPAKQQASKATDSQQIQSSPKQPTATTPVTTTRNLATPSTPVSPARPNSAQGKGLGALEQRLRSTSMSSSTAASTSPAPATSAVKATSSDPPTSATSALRRKAAAAEDRRRKASLESSQKATEPATKAKNVSTTSARSDHAKSTRSEVPSLPSASSATTATRKVVDPKEARQLGKQAVDRIGGWLEQSTSPAASRRASHDGAEKKMPASETSVHSPKTPSPSAIVLQRKDSDASAAASTIASPSAALGGGTLRTVSSDRPEQKRMSGASIARSTSSSRDIQALASAFGGVKVSSSNDSASGAKDAAVTASIVKQPTTSKIVYRDIESDDDRKGSGLETNKSVDSQVIAKATTVEVAAAKERPAPAATSSTTASVVPSEYDDRPRVDVRSVRGGRGGRVASAASLWASIANGTDGKLPVPSRTDGNGGAGTSSSAECSDTSPSTMRRTMINARPQARRSMNGEAPALDFTDRGKVEAAIREQEQEQAQAEAEAEAEREKVAQAAKPSSSSSPSSSSLPSHAAPKAIRGKKAAAIAIPSAFSGHPSHSSGKPGPITRRAAPPFLNTTTPKVHMAGGGDGTNGEMAKGEDASAPSTEPTVMSGRGTTRAVGKERMAELRNLFAATAAK